MAASSNDAAKNGTPAHDIDHRHQKHCPVQPHAWHLMADQHHTADVATTPAAEQNADAQAEQSVQEGADGQQPDSM